MGLNFTLHLFFLGISIVISHKFLKAAQLWSNLQKLLVRFVFESSQFHLTELVEGLQDFLLHVHLKVCQHVGQHFLHEAAHLQHPPGTRAQT